jgi:hypothetical protein
MSDSLSEAEMVRLSELYTQLEAAGVASARKLEDHHLPSNELIHRKTKAKSSQDREA